MRIRSVQVRLRTVAAVGVLAAGIPVVALAGVHPGQAGNLADAGTAGSSLGATLSGGTSALQGAGSVLSGTTSGAKAPTTVSGATDSTTPSSGSCPTSGLPADKVTVAGSKAKVAGPNVDVVILAACMRTSSPADLTLSLTSECSILTDLTTVGNDSASTEGVIKMWVEIDGKNVGVLPAPPGASDDGQVTFCDLAHSQTTSNFTADPNATIEQGLKTMTANGFNWVAINVGNGVHFITVHSMLSQQTTGDATAQEFIDARTLVVNTTETAQNMAS